MFRKCFIYYDFGVHHLWINVPEASMRAVIDNLSSEFEIHVETIDNPMKITIFSIINYYGEKYSIAKYYSR